MNRNVFLRKLGGRLIRTISISFWVMVISYSLIRLSPGDPAEARLGAGADPAAIDKLREDLGLNENAFTAFINYFTGVLQGDLGVSLANDLEVIEIIKRSFPVTLTYIDPGINYFKSSTYICC